eukprot:12901461-Prorocentrum_lima.AAC.1
MPAPPHPPTPPQPPSPPQMAAETSLAVYGAPSVEVRVPFEVADSHDHAVAAALAQQPPPQPTRPPP